MPDFSEEEVTAGARALHEIEAARAMWDDPGDPHEEDLADAQSVLEASGAVPRGEYERLREGMNAAIKALGPGDDEDSDSPGNMAFAILMHALSTPDTPPGERGRA